MSSSAIAGPSRYGGFSPLPIMLLHPSTITWKPTPHYLWIREDRKTGAAAPISAGDASLALPPGRTLFVANLPVDCEEADLREVFVEYGPVERVVFKVAETGKGEEQWAEDDEDEDDEDNDDTDEEPAEDDDGGWKDASELEKEFAAEVEAAPSAQPALSARAEARKRRRERRDRGPVAPDVVPLPSLDPRTQPFLPVCSSAHVVFLDALALERALTVAPTRKPKVLKRAHASPTGLAYFRALARTTRPPMDVVLAHADSAIALFDHHAALAASRASKGAITDEDGFTLVVRGGRFGRTAGKGDKGVGVASRRFMLESKKVKGLEGVQVDAREGLLHGKDKKKKGAAAIEGFYRFQRHEQKRQELADMRKAFEADKAKVADLKAKNRYKPY